MRRCGLPLAGFLTHRACPAPAAFGQLAQYYSCGNASSTVAQDWLTETCFWFLKFKWQPESFVDSKS